MNEEFNIEFQDREIKVIASWDLGEEGDYDTQPINGAYYTDYVYYKDRDITGILSLESFNEIFEIINE